jgi:hypothetical protein
MTGIFYVPVNTKLLKQIHFSRADCGNARENARISYFFSRALSFSFRRKMLTRPWFVILFPPRVWPKFGCIYCITFGEMWWSVGAVFGRRLSAQTTGVFGRNQMEKKL